MMPIIHTFASQTAPDKECCLAFIYEMQKKSLHRLPMVFSASTEDAARLAAQNWWDEERAKEERKRAMIEKMTRFKMEAKP